jgi:hypothetical protein
MATTLTSTGIRFPNGQVQISRSLKKYYTKVEVGMANYYPEGSDTLYDFDLTSVTGTGTGATVPDYGIPIVIVEFDYWVIWTGWSDVYFRTQLNARRHSVINLNTVPALSSYQEVVRYNILNGALGGPHITTTNFYYFPFPTNAV